MATASPRRRDATAALLDAAESLLVEVGYAAITVRRLADRAGLNHGLVHYYFGSMEEVFLQTLERFTDRLIERQIALYAAEAPFVDRWRTAMSYVQADLDSGYQKVWFELQAMAWNHAEMRDRLAAVMRRWIDVLVPAFDVGLDELGVDKDRFPTTDVVTLVTTFNQGVMLQHLSGFTDGHEELLTMFDRWLTDRHRAPGPSPG